MANIVTNQDVKLTRSQALKIMKLLELIGCQALELRNRNASQGK